MGMGKYESQNSKLKWIIVSRLENPTHKSLNCLEIGLKTDYRENNFSPLVGIRIMSLSQPTIKNCDQQEY